MRLVAGDSLQFRTVHSTADTHCNDLDASRSQFGGNVARVGRIVVFGLSAISDHHQHPASARSSSCCLCEHFVGCELKAAVQTVAVPQVRDDVHASVETVGREVVSEFDPVVRIVAVSHDSWLRAGSSEPTCGRQ